MKCKMMIIASIVMASAMAILFYGIQNYSEPFSKSTLELRFEKETVTVWIRDETHVSTNYTELTTIPTSSLVKAHDKLPETSSADRIIAGSMVSETERSGTYLTEDGFREFWYTMDDGNGHGIITMELRDHEFDRMVFGSENNLDVIARINEIASDSKPIPSDTGIESQQFKPSVDVGILNQREQKIENEFLIYENGLLGFKIESPSEYEFEEIPNHTSYGIEDSKTKQTLIEVSDKVKFSPDLPKFYKSSEVPFSFGVMIYENDSIAEGVWEW